MFYRSCEGKNIRYRTCSNTVSLSGSKVVQTMQRAQPQRRREEGLLHEQLRWFHICLVAFQACPAGGGPGDAGEIMSVSGTQTELWASLPRRSCQFNRGMNRANRSPHEPGRSSLLKGSFSFHCCQSVGSQMVVWSWRVLTLRNKAPRDDARYMSMTGASPSSSAFSTTAVQH